MGWGLTCSRKVCCTSGWGCTGRGGRCGLCLVCGSGLACLAAESGVVVSVTTELVEVNSGLGKSSEGEVTCNISHHKTLKTKFHNYI